VNRLMRMLVILITLRTLDTVPESREWEGSTILGFMLINMTNMLKKSSSPPDDSVSCNQLHGVWGRKAATR